MDKRKYFDDMNQIGFYIAMETYIMDLSFSVLNIHTFQVVSNR